MRIASGPRLCSSAKTAGADKQCLRVIRTGPTITSHLQPPDPPTSQRPLMIYDGDCSFCRRWIKRWGCLTGDTIDYQPYQTAAQRFADIPREDFGKSVFLIEPDGRRTRGAQALFRALSLAGSKRYLLWLYEAF